MSEVTANMGRTFPPTDIRSESMANSTNNRYHQQSIDRNLLRKPDSYVYIFSVSKRGFNTNHNLVRVPVIACGPDERYKLVATLPEPFQQPDIEQVNGAVIARAHEARAVAMDYCNPNNTTFNQDFVVPAANVLGIGNNLSAQGVFWVEQADCTFVVDGKTVPFGTRGAVPVPPEAEIAKAEKRVETYYEDLIEKARTLELSNPKELENVLNQDFHMAAEYYGIETSWHKKQVKAIECPQCGEKKKAGVLFHPSNGVFCIEPSKAGWEAAVNAGIKKLDDVPPQFSWTKKVETKTPAIKPKTNALDMDVEEL